MKFIWGIFKRDVRHATRNVIAVIVSMGLVLVPALYAWFNIAASWDPYGNTAALKVAVANTDAGYKSDLIPVRVNIGETVVSTLRSNHQLDWQFVSRDDAVDGVKSGKYYAAIVIPEEFSADMMTLFSTKVQHSKLEYYLNEKVNPIAPHITDKGASTVSDTINTTFAKTIGQVGLDLASSLMNYSDSPQMSEYVANANENLSTMSKALSGAAAQATAYSNLLASANDIIESTNKLLKSTSSVGDQAKEALNQGKSGASSLSEACKSVTAGVNEALEQASASFDDLKTKVNEALSTPDKNSSEASKQLDKLRDQVSSGTSVYEQYNTDLQKMRQAVEQLPDSNVSKQPLLDAIDREIKALQTAQSDTQQLADKIDAASKKITESSTVTNQSRTDIISQIDTAKNSITTVRDDYATNVKPKFDALGESVDTLINQTSSVIDELSNTAGSIDSATGNVSLDVSDIRSTLDTVAGTLTKAADTINALIDRLNAQANGDDASSSDNSELETLTNADSSTIATLLSAPVELNRVAIYPIANYGSAMTPFYTILAIWVGAVILCAMMKVGISDRQKARVLGLGDTLPSGAGVVPDRPGNAAKWGLHLRHEYFGRYAFFALLALLQGTLVCLGDLFFLGVQANHAMQFIVVGWVAALVFSNIVYTLTVSFGDIGKAIAVVLLVMQVAGSGGTFPIETLPSFFRALYPFLPFPHAIDAMHAAMAGSYGTEYWTDLGELALFLIPSLLLGLLLRKPVIRLNAWISHNLELTKVM
ncbi:YhgE/Pip domain-containing protein [Bifidobacterium panos]|uniref:ABC-2 family transporter protein n=1 Tax=Bifidobacterium panos TaxID=2675321 RepID=A0ABX1SYX6_9BIFI|nr:YhgE/Pip domain-containing protein [Bifidobacterium sp. DSM 109963]NMN01814.1 ABC-2 family transporter protein [Bifidobacterium sp. DSM 109963]